MQILPEVTLGIALLGAVLSLANTWRLFDRDRVKVKLIFGSHEDPRDGRPWISVEVVNLSNFPISVAAVEMQLRGESKNYLVLTDSELPFPRRLEPRASFTILERTFQKEPPWPLIKWIRAKTACGKVFYIRPPVMSERLKNKLRLALERANQRANQPKQ